MKKIRNLFILTIIIINFTGCKTKQPPEYEYIQKARDLIEGTWNGFIDIPDLNYRTDINVTCTDIYSGSGYNPWDVIRFKFNMQPSCNEYRNGSIILNDDVPYISFGAVKCAEEFSFNWVHFDGEVESKHFMKGTLSTNLGNGVWELSR
jgi:hypothetical protein